MNLEELEAFVKTLEEANKKLFFKLSRFGVWLVISSVLFGIVAGGILQVYTFLGFEETLILMLLLIVMSNVRQQFEKA